MSVIAMMAISCGQNNTSGKSGNSGTNGGITGIGTFGSNVSMQQVISVVGQQNPCLQGGNRIPVQIPLQGIQVNAGSTHVGVSPFGDIAIVQNAGQSIMSLYICPRAGLTGQGQLLYNPIIEADQNCPVGKITAADVMLTGQVSYQVKFAPIHIPGTDRISQLCTNFNQPF